MHARILAALQNEERELANELRATMTFRRLDAIRRLIALYGGAEAAPADLPPRVAAGLTGAATAGDAVPAEAGEEQPGPQAVREGNKAVSIVRAALAAVTN